MGKDKGIQRSWMERRTYNTIEGVLEGMRGNEERKENAHSGTKMEGTRYNKLPQTALTAH